MNPTEFLPQVYDELRKLAAVKLASEQPGQTLDATGLVHEAILKLGMDRRFASERDYLNAASQAMRRILVDRARARKAIKRGEGKRIDLDSNLIEVPPPDDDLQVLDEALSLLAVEQPQIAELVQLKYFGGLTLAQCADALGVSARTADTWWAYARSWLSIRFKT